MKKSPQRAAKTVTSRQRETILKQGGGGVAGFPPQGSSVVRR